jgi:iron complex outermembrane recepter protein
MRYSLRLLTNILICMALGTPLVHAQTSPSAVVDGVSSDSLEQIIVTAQKRDERLVNVPISITAVSGKGLDEAGITDMSGLAQIVPGLHMDTTSSSLQPSIRGVGTAVNEPGANSNVPIYVDGIYRPSMLTNDFSFIDVDSVQVLKGPQGTLFGRNATGGAIVVTTKSPTFDTHVDARIGYGNYNTVNGSIFATSGITDKIAGSIMIAADRTDGFITNVLTDRKADEARHLAARAKLLFEASADIKFELTLDYSHSDDPLYNLWNAYNGWSNGALVPGAIVVSSRGLVSNDAPVAHIASSKGASLKGEFDLGFATLRSYTGARADRSYEAIDLDASSAPIVSGHWYYPTNSFSQELDLGSSGGLIDWVTGLYYYDSNEANVSAAGSAFGSPYVPLYNAGNIDKSYAAFGDATYNLNKWHFTLGTRYAIDHVVGYYDDLTQIVPPTDYVKASHTWDSLTPRAVIRYEITPDSNVYASWSKGSKAGLFDSTSLSSVPINPEKLTAVEVGYKIATSNWQLETDVFHYDYKDLQVASYHAHSAYILNAANSEIYGAEGHVSMRVTKELSADLGAAYTHARYVTFDNAPVQTFNPVTGVVISSIPVLRDGVMQRTPTFSANAGLNYKLPLWGGTFDANGNYSYRTNVYFDFTEGAHQPGYGLLNARAAWTDSSGHWTYSLSGENLTNKKYIVQVFEQTQEFGQIYGNPTMVTLQVTAHF